MGAEALSNHHIMIGKPPQQALSSELAEARQLETFFPAQMTEEHPGVARIQCLPVLISCTV